MMEFVGFLFALFLGFVIGYHNKAIGKFIYRILKG